MFRQPAAEGMIPTTDGARLCYRLEGDGPPVVLPNGFHLLAPFQPLTRHFTLIAFDLRYRGRSEAGSETAAQRGILQDVDDLETVRDYFGLEKPILIGHSYMGFLVVLYALHHVERVERILQVGPLEPRPGKEYPPHLTAADDVLRQALAALAALQRERDRHEPVELCRKAWALLRPIYVVDPADADKVTWERCELPNERAFFRHWMGCVLPSIRALELEPSELARVTAPVLTLHGRRDRSAPYGGGREWATLLPNARLITIDAAGHAPWVEAHERVVGGIAAFLAGQWPAEAEKIEVVDPEGAAAAPAP
jgi:pimeloyl-ACP methyl ester carboxylesterase